MKKLILLMMVLLVGGLAGCSDKDDGMLKISSDPGDAEIYIDGERKGNTPAKKGQTYAIKLSEGEHTIEIIKPISDPNEYDQYFGEKTVFVAEKSLQTVSIELEERQSEAYREKWEEKQRKKAAAKAEESLRKAAAKAEKRRRLENSIRSGTATLSNGLVAYYEFEGNADDVSGNGNNGTVFGGVSYVDGVLGQGIKLNGVNSAGGTANPDHIMVPNSNTLQFTTAMSISYWVRIDGNMSQTSANCSGASIPSIHGATISKRGDRFGFTFNDYELGSSFSINPWDGGKGVSASALTTSFKQFRHMVYVVNGQNISMYVNGVLVKTVVGVVDFGTANLQDLYLGVAQNLNGACLKYWNPLDGTLDDVRIYNRVLSQVEIGQLAGLSK